MNVTERSHQGAPLTAGEIMLLQAHRLERDLTYRQLAARIGIGLTKVHDLLNKPNVIANARTAFKVRTYLDSVDRATKVPARRRAARERATA